MAKQPKTPPKVVRRGGNPAWVPGRSGNPGGIPKKRSELTALCQEHGLDVFHELLEIVKAKPDMVPRADGNGFERIGPSHADRIAAGKLILAYGYGMPRQMVQVEQARDLPDVELVKRLVEAFGDSPETRQILEAQFREVKP
jgi:hypothetical protein